MDTTSLVAQLVKYLPAMWETRVQSLGWEDPWRRKWQPTPVPLSGKSHGGGAWWAAVHGVAKSRTRLSDFTFTSHFHALEKEMATRSSVLAWRTPGRGSLVGCHLWGHTESDMTDVTHQQQSSYAIFKGFPGGPSGKESACQCRRYTNCRFDPWVGKMSFSLQCCCKEQTKYFINRKNSKNAKWSCFNARAASCLTLRTCYWEDDHIFFYLWLVRAITYIGQLLLCERKESETHSVVSESLWPMEFSRPEYWNG